MTRRLPERAAGRCRQHGAATLVVVMLLFFVISLTAAYTARNLIFEQRTSANHYRGAQSVEAAEAGLEWATAMLNGGLVDEACLPITAPAPVGATSFRQRYLNIDPVTGVVSPKFRSDGVTALWAACQFDGTAWVCSCPSDALPTLTPPTGAGSFPAFGVRFVINGTLKSGVQRIEVNGCNSFDIPCVTNIVSGTQLQCRGGVCSVLALHNGVRMIPAATLTTGGPLTGAPGATLGVVNADPNSGITVHAPANSMTAPALMLIGPPGTPASQTLADNDSNLATAPSGPLVADSDACRLCLFSAVFGVDPTTYRQQPAALQLDCSTACTATQVNDLVALNPGRMVWLEGAGGLNLATATDIGSPAAPVILVVRGPFSVTGNATVYGLVFADSAAINAGNAVRGTLQGALVVAGNVSAGGSAQLIYDRTNLTALMQTTGSFVRVPGSWRDFK